MILKIMRLVVVIQVVVQVRARLSVQPQSLGEMILAFVEAVINLKSAAEETHRV